MFVNKKNIRIIHGLKVVVNILKFITNHGKPKKKQRTRTFFVDWEGITQWLQL